MEGSVGMFVHKQEWLLSRTRMETIVRAEKFGRPALQFLISMVLGDPELSLGMLKALMVIAMEPLKSGIMTGRISQWLAIADDKRGFTYAVRNVCVMDSFGLGSFILHEKSHDDPGAWAECPESKCGLSF